jgi:hypothetical protein
VKPPLQVLSMAPTDHLLVQKLLHFFRQDVSALHILRRIYCITPHQIYQIISLTTHTSPKHMTHSLTHSLTHHTHYTLYHTLYCTYKSSHNTYIQILLPILQLLGVFELLLPLWRVPHDQQPRQLVTAQVVPLHNLYCALHDFVFHRNSIDVF